MISIKNIFFKYPVFTNNVLFINKKGNIYIKFIKEDKIQPIRAQIWKILQTVDGCHDINQITSFLKVSWAFESNEILNFFLKCENLGILVLSDNPSLSYPKFENDLDIFPEIFSVVLTDGCNIRCNYCFGDYGNSNSQASFLPTKIVDQLFQRMSQEGTKGIELTGGEPLFHPDFIEIYLLSVKYFEFTTILSNGVLFSDIFFNTYKEYWHKTYFQITIDGGTEKTNSLVRQVKNTWNKTFNNIERLCKLNAKMSVVYTLTYENKEELLDTCKLLENIGVKHLQIVIPDSRGRGTNLHLPCGSLINDQRSEFAKELIQKAKDARQKFPHMFRALKATKLEDIRVKNCGAGWLSATIYSTGEIFACQSLYKSLVIGNILKDDIGAIYKNSPLVKYLSNFSKDPISSKCNGCEYQCAVCLYRIITSNIDLLSRGKQLCPIATQYQMDKYFDFEKLVEFKIPNRIYND